MKAVGVSRAKVVFKIGERKLILDYRRVGFRAWDELFQQTQITQITLLPELTRMNPQAITALVWLERKQRERKLQFAEVYREMLSADGDDDFEDLEVVAILVWNKKTGGWESPNGEAPEDADDAQEGGDPTGGS